MHFLSQQRVIQPSQKVAQPHMQRVFVRSAEGSLTRLRKYAGVGHHRRFTHVATQARIVKVQETVCGCDCTEQVAELASSEGAVAEQREREHDAPCIQVPCLQLEERLRIVLVVSRYKQSVHATSAAAAIAVVEVYLM